MDSQPHTSPGGTASEACAPLRGAAASGVTSPQPVLSTGSLFHLPLPDIARIARSAGFGGLDLVMGSPKIAPGPAVLRPTPCARCAWCMPRSATGAPGAGT